MTATARRWTTLADEPGWAERLPTVEAGGPPFLAELTAAHRARLTATCPEHQWVCVGNGRAEAVVRAVAVPWDGTGAGAPEGVGPAMRTAGASGADTLAVLDLAVAPPLRGAGRGRALLGELEALRALAGLSRLLVLLRPHDKRHHPLVPFARYLAAVDERGRPRDGWLAAAWEAGLLPVRAVDRSLVARAPVADWQRWYGRAFPVSGPYLLEGAIKPAIVEHERDEGRYREPHLWVAPRASLAHPPYGAGVGSGADGWPGALEAAGVVPGSRSHREVRPRA